MNTINSDRDAGCGDTAECVLVIEERSSLSDAMKYGITAAASVPVLIAVTMLLSAAGLVLHTIVSKGDLFAAIILTLGIGLLLLAVLTVLALLTVAVGAACGWLAHRLFYGTGVSVNHMTVVFVLICLFSHFGWSLIAEHFRDLNTYG